MSLISGSSVVQQDELQVYAKWLFKGGVCEAVTQRTADKFDA